MRAICVPLFAFLTLAGATASAGAIDLVGPFDPALVGLFPPKPRLAIQPTPADVPGAADAIAEIDTWLPTEPDPTFERSGLAVGDVGPAVELRTLEGAPVTLPAQNAERPVLVVTVSLTCPIARDHIADAARLAERFAGEVDVRLVYVVEAHPVVDPSPYTGAEWPSKANTAAGILYRQPTTMGERTALAALLRDSLGVTLPILVDGPDNAWWRTYGPAPNQAVLLGPDGTVLVEHGWLNGEGLDMEADIARVLELSG